MTRHATTLVTAAVFAFVSTAAAAADNPAAEIEQPNFVIIMADDMGYNDAGCYGNERFETPHIDALAANGMRFTDFYVSSPVCSATRAGLITGRYQQRAGIDGVITAANHRDHGLHVDEVTFSRLLQEAGYATAIFGKWHLGYQTRFNPIHHGFNEFVGFVSGNVDYFSHIDQTGVFDWWHGDEQVREQGYTTHLITENGVRFIEDNHDQPFLLYLPHEAPHYPYQGPDDPPEREPGYSRDDFHPHGEREDRRVAYAEMMRELDEGVGEIVAALHEHDIAERTFVLFFSDNGANRYGSNAPLRSYKGRVFEGGIRVPAIACWPGVIEPGQVSSETVISLDVMPTLLELAGVSLPQGHALDGVSMLPALQGEAMPPRKLYWYFNRRRAMRDGPWKLVVDRDQDPMLFNLDDDISESDDLAETHPERLQRMLDQYEQWHEDVTTGATPQPPPGG